MFARENLKTNDFLFWSPVPEVGLFIERDFGKQNETEETK
jgi:hypothetical protein